MICASLATLLLNATLLGGQSLTAEKISVVVPVPTHESQKKSCDDSLIVSPLGSNATLTLKDAKGQVVYEAKVRVPRFRFYTNDSSEASKFAGGVYPATSAVVSVKFPDTKQTQTAVTANLRTDDRTFSQTSAIAAPPVTPAPLKVKTLGLIGLK